MPQTDPYVQYYLNQQQGNGLPVFKGSPWQRGYGQTGFGLGGIFRSVARAVMPMVKSGAKALGKIALNTGASVLSDVVSGKNLKEAAKSRIKEAAKDVGKKAAQQVQTFAQTGRGKRGGKQTGRKNAKKRKTPPTSVRSNPTKKRKTTPEDIFG